MTTQSTLGLFKKGFLFYREQGPKETTTLIRKNVAELLRNYVNQRFDRRFHVDTSGVTQLSNLTCNSSNKEHGVLYEPTPLRTLNCMFSLLPSDVSDFTFVDFGSGKGRTTLYASNFNFKKIIGVEFAKELHAVAERNVGTYRSKMQKCRDITPLCMDATEFSPPEGKCVFYFFHPFREPVMRRVLCNIEASYRKDPRKLIMLYYHPRCDEVVESSTIFLKRKERPVPFDLSAEPCIYRRHLALYETPDTPNLAERSIGSETRIHSPA